MQALVDGAGGGAPGIRVAPLASPLLLLRAPALLSLHRARPFFATAPSFLASSAWLSSRCLTRLDLT